MEIFECDVCMSVITPHLPCGCNREIDYIYGVTYQVSKVRPKDYEEEE
jgi:hypothetical protein